MRSIEIVRDDRIRYTLSEESWFECCPIDARAAIGQHSNQDSSLECCPIDALARAKSQTTVSTLIMALRWKCMCCAFLCIFLSELLTHLNTIHRDDKDFRQNCGLPDCSSKTEYTSANSFVKHVRSRHRTLLDSTYEAVFDGNQNIHVSDHDSECHVSDTGKKFYFIFHSHQ